MNALIQQQSNLIGAEEDILALENTTSAKLLILGDSHGYFDVVENIIVQFGNEVDALVFSGDGFCDIVSYMEESFINEKLRKAFPPVIIPVKGNGDSSSYSVNKSSDGEEKIMHLTLPPRITCNIAGRNIFVAHGDHYRVDMGTDTLLAAAHAVDADMVFFGHTHRTYWEEVGGTLIVNPGSCSRSRSKLPPSFVVVSFPGKQDRYTIEYYGIDKAMFNKYKFIPLSVHMN